MSLQEKILKYQKENTPKFDKLAHYYWSDKWYSTIGSFFSLIVILFIDDLLLKIISLTVPFITAFVAAYFKEVKDKKDYDGFDWKDIWATTKPSYKDIVFLIIILILR